MFEFDAGAIERMADVEETALHASGAQAGDSIGWLALNQSRAIALLRACERIGARYVPLNWRLSAHELAAIARHAGLQRLLHDAPMAALASQVRALVDLPQPSAPDHRPGDAMLVYTSGTTGEPKGAIHTAAAMRANIAAAIDAQGLSAATRTLAVLPLFHVGGLCIQVLPTLAAGVCTRASRQGSGCAMWRRGGRRRACWCRRRCAR
jgi:fatty-acyl-CoA synthase